ncbi:MAG: hypothetical protein QOF53_2449 [Nocardioidaceae bacterium]|jgi:hypothetical protein|nr:hypothetical protein [Nocardioidaceae bacterium]
MSYTKSTVLPVSRLAGTGHAGPDGWAYVPEDLTRSWRRRPRWPCCSPS